MHTLINESRENLMNIEQTYDNNRRMAESRSGGLAFLQQFWKPDHSRELGPALDMKSSQYPDMTNYVSLESLGFMREVRRIFVAEWYEKKRFETVGDIWTCQNPAIRCLQPIMLEDIDFINCCLYEDETQKIAQISSNLFGMPGFNARVSG